METMTVLAAPPPSPPVAVAGGLGDGDELGRLLAAILGPGAAVVATLEAVA